MRYARKQLRRRAERHALALYVIGAGVAADPRAGALRELTPTEVARILDRWHEQRGTHAPLTTEGPSEPTRAA